MIEFFADARAFLPILLQGLLATRNVRDFMGCGVQVLNPFEPQLQ